jgi:DNA-directed RNA polymerase specialized sigma24 family protein
MTSREGPPAARPRRRWWNRFASTRWTLIRRVASADPVVSDAAFTDFYNRYWKPLCYVAETRGRFAHDDAEDVVQDFLFRFHTSGAVKRLREAGCEFRAYLVGALIKFMATVRRRAHALKRGGGEPPLSLDFAFDMPEAHSLQVPADLRTPHTELCRRFALAVLDEVWRRLRADCEANGLVRKFDVLKDAILDDPPPGGHAAMAKKLGITVAAVDESLYRLRKRYQKHFVATVAADVPADQVEAQVEFILQALGG